MKIVLYITLGFLLNSGLRTLHSYSYWKNEASAECRAIKDFDEATRCIRKNMGLIDTMGWFLVYPSYNWEEWGFEKP